MISSLLQESLAELKQQGLYRKRVLPLSRDSQPLLNFSSNDYLSFTGEPQVKAVFQEGFARYPTGSGGSMVICGYHPVHRELEEAFANALSADDALLFSSGYAANLAVIALLAQVHCHLFIDKAVHASFYDGLKPSSIQYQRFLHNNLSDLEQKLATGYENSLIVTEGLFSMSGQLANLTEIARFKADLLVDEAHAFGVLGKEGLGAVVQHGLTQKEVPLRIIPLGKAFAAQGAMVVGRGEWIEALLQCARSHIYSTAVSPALAYGLLRVLDLLREADERRAKLSLLIGYFRQKSNENPGTWRCSQSAIQQLQLGCPHKALHYANVLREQGIFCQAMREPTVSRKETGLRVLLNYHHEFSDIDRLFSYLNQLHEITY